jgi:hypothetical protein
MIPTTLNLSCQLVGLMDRTSRALYLLHSWHFYVLVAVHITGAIRASGLGTHLSLLPKKKSAAV